MTITDTAQSTPEGTSNSPFPTASMRAFPHVDAVDITDEQRSQVNAMLDAADEAIAEFAATVDGDSNDDEHDAALVLADMLAGLAELVRTFARTSPTPSAPGRAAFPADGVCTCGFEGPAMRDTHWQLVETGYQQWQDAEWVSPGADEHGSWAPLLVATSRGWDDMSEGGDDQFVQCAHCLAIYDTPDEVDYA